MEKRIEVRPHHGMCFLFYEGKGYSAEFTDHMGSVVRAFADSPGLMIRLTSTADVVCDRCPNNESGICASQDKVKRYDEAVLGACDIAEGDVMPYADFITLIRERIIDRNLRKAICSDCSWNYICGKDDPDRGCDGI